jgi:single-stranded DNA-binding protein
LSYAKAEISGFTTRDADLRATKTGKFITSFSVAVSFGEGENKKTSFFDVDIWDKRPELVKGTLVKCAGYLTQERWVGKDGVNHSKIKLVAKTVEIVRPASGAQSTGIEALGEKVDNVAPFDDSSIPF